jgi:hypothetical protein
MSKRETLANGPDAELIRLCGALVANQARMCLICDTVLEDDERGPFIDPVHAEYGRLREGLEAAPIPTTFAGLTAMSLAALADCDKDTEGKPVPGDNLSDVLMFRLAQAVVAMNAESIG